MDAADRRITPTPSLARLREQFGDDPRPALADAFAGKGPLARSIFDARTRELAEAADAAPPDLAWQLAEEGLRAVEKLEQGGLNADLSPLENAAVAALIIVTGRPAILIQNGLFPAPPPDDWGILDQFRQAIQGAFPSVGRIEIPGHPALDWTGTGFLVAPDVVMTNRHVAKDFVIENFGGGGWHFFDGVTPRIDYVEELGSDSPAEFTITEVIGIHEDDDVDLALLRVKRQSPSGAPAPQPLTIASTAPTGDHRQVYVVGYPHWDPNDDVPNEVFQIFGEIFNVKRLQPGEIMSIPAGQRIFHHDCSTLVRNSGSPVFDLQTNQVVGLHFGGSTGEANHAVALWELTDDPLLVNAGVNFV